MAEAWRRGSRLFRPVRCVTLKHVRPRSPWTRRTQPRLAPYLIPRNDELEIGKQVIVYYDPNNPAKNALTDFGELSLEEVGPIPTLMVGIGAVALYIYWTRRKKLATRKDSGLNV
jgi:hypothetical protein